MKHIILLVCLCVSGIFLSACQGKTQTRVPNTSSSPAASAKTLVGGGCDGCELMYAGMPAAIHINATDTSVAWQEDGQRLLVTGTVYQQAGKTPAPNVIIYYWHTDHMGHYSPAPEMNEEARRHGHIRGWIKTDSQGKYALYTKRPVSYPNSTLPAHIHLSIKEPNLPNEYYIDDLVFDDDPLLTGEKRRTLENRGGSGVLRVVRSGDMQIAEHTIVLGLHIPNYPAASKAAVTSGLAIGEDQPSFMPYHAWGPDKGKKACPVCKYGRHQGILYFVGTHPDWVSIRKWLTFLENESQQRQKYLKVYFVYGNPSGYSKEAREKELEKLGKELHITQTALTCVPSLTDTDSEIHRSKINPEVENTFIIFQHRTIIDSYINLSPTEANFRQLTEVLDRKRSPYADLPELPHD